MGTYLTPIIPRRNITLKHLYGKTIAFDALVELYQFLSLIRQPDGTPLKAPNGTITSHLVGLSYRLSRLISDYHIKPIFVFDGPPHPLKERIIKERKKQSEKAYKEWLEALKRGDLETAFSKAVVAIRLNNQMIDDAMKLLTLMGIPVIKSPHDAEAQAAYIVKRGEAWCIGSKDYDSLLYGGKRLVRFITFTGFEYLPSKHTIRPLKPELIELETVLNSLRITYEQLIDIAILIGTDYNEGIPGVGPKKALKLIKKYGSIENLMTYKMVIPDFDINEVRSIFLNPDVNKNYQIKFNPPNKNGLIRFLVDEKGFSLSRVKIIIERLEKAEIWRSKQITLG